MINFANHLVSSGVPVTLVVLKNNLTLAGLVDSGLSSSITAALVNLSVSIA